MNGLNVCRRVGLRLPVSLVAAGSFAWMAVAQDLKEVSSGESKKTDVSTGFSAAQAKLTDLQKSIGSIMEKLTQPHGSAAEYEKVVDEYIAWLKEAEASMNATSDLGKLVAQTIKTNQEKQAEYEKNAYDPNLSPEISANYKRLAERFKNNVAGLLDKKLLLEKEVIKLQSHIKLFTQRKRLLSDLIHADMTEEANRLVLDIGIGIVRPYTDVPCKMAREIGKPGPVPPGRSDVLPSK